MSEPGSCASIPLVKYDVFINFRGEDIRDNFLSHLIAELKKKNIDTFIDDTLKRGEEISSTLHKAIEESQIYVLVFSENYAFSRWCLDELTSIVECSKKYERRHVIPVFYKVDPSTVRYQKDRYADAFKEHEERFKENLSRVNAWKDALFEAAGLVGWDSKVVSPEHTLVVDIVKDILKKLKIDSKCDLQDGIIGIDNHIAKIRSSLQLESPDIRFLGIWGMGGIGKTTIARQIYHELASQFCSSGFIFNCQKEIEKHGVDHIKNKYSSALLEEEERASSGSGFSSKRLKRAKVLLIIDDVNNSYQLQCLIGGHGNFGPGSRIIVTSRDVQVLKIANADAIYEVKEMDFQDSLKLFSLNAFKQNHPEETYMDVSVKVLSYAKGIPLALKVLGSLLRGRPREEWESQLQKLEKIPEKEILEILKLSYDGLDEDQKNIFLDMACFYGGYEEISAAQTLDDCGFFAKIGMAVLKDRCLISAREGKIVMHDLIQEMSQNIVRQECVKNPGKRSRLWEVEEIEQVLRKNKGTDAIECILLDISKIKEADLHAETFNKMDNLRMLHFYKPSEDYWVYGSNLSVGSSLESFLDTLKILHWDNFPQRSLAQNYCPENLVRLEMRHSKLEQLWEGDQRLLKLKRLDLSNSRRLTGIPDLCQSPNIEEIILSNCVRLGEVYSTSILNKLNCLCLDGCAELDTVYIPCNIMRRSSGVILLNNCPKLQSFSLSISDVPPPHLGRPRPPPLEMLRPGLIGKRAAGGTTLGVYDEMLREGVSSILATLNNLCWLDLSDCRSLRTLPFDLSMLKFLKILCLRGCSNLGNFPQIKGRMENVAELILDQTAIRELPSSLCYLVGLQVLSLHGCTSLEIIPPSIGTLTKLSKLGLSYCESLQTFSSSVFKLNLTKLDFHGCSMLSKLPEILEPAKSFADINLTKTAIKELPSSFENLVGLRILRLIDCSDLESLPNSIVNLNLLTNLDCSGCAKLTEIPSDIGRLSLLTELSLLDTGIVNLPQSIAHLSCLKSLDLGGCSNFGNFPQIKGRMENLAKLVLDETAIRELPSPLCYLVGLENLSLHSCSSLEIIPPSICTLTKLSKLDLSYCESLQTFPSSVFKLNLTKLDFHGCSMLSKLPEILEPAKSFADINLTETAIKELPSSFENLVGLRILRLIDCSDLESLPNSIVNLNLLSKLDCSGCAKLTEIPSDIGRLSLLTELSLQDTGIVNLPKSIAHLSSLKSLDISDCKNLRCIPQLPPFIEKLLALDCPSIKIVMSISSIQIPSDSTEGAFGFHLTNSQHLDPSARANIVDHARLKITDNAYGFVFFHFPGSAVPHWFPCRAEGHSVTINTDSLNLCNDNRIIGLALCFSYRLVGTNDIVVPCFSYKLKFESAGGIVDLLHDYYQRTHYIFREGRHRIVDGDHTFLWKYEFETESMSLMPCHVHSFTFQVMRDQADCAHLEINECGICPLYNK